MPSKSIFDPVMLTDDERRAFKAMSEGKASGRQQQLALSSIVNRLCAYPGIVAHENTNATYFMSGRHFVGAAIVGVVNSPFKQKEEDKS
ncbi:hypothetical protein [Brucella sp. BZ]|uniref:hypothetical protein n=1 Tax=Brucella sp. BZ TaxID=3381346 RepID=UPI0039E91AF1